MSDTIYEIQQMWLDQNLTELKACAYKANIFYRIFEQTICRQN
jgi:hypothetical protein